MSGAGKMYESERRLRPIPEAVREAVLQRADRICEDCGADVPLELHHRTYYHDHSPKHPILIFGLERPDDLAALCRECHLARHVVEGEFYADPEDAAAERDYLDEAFGK